MWWGKSTSSNIFTCYISVGVLLRLVSVIGVVRCPLCRAAWRRQDSESSSHPGHSQCLSSFTQQGVVVGPFMWWKLIFLVCPLCRFPCSSVAARWSAGQQEVAPVPPNISSSPSPSPWPSTLRWADLVEEIQWSKLIHQTDTHSYIFMISFNMNKNDSSTTMAKILWNNNHALWMHSAASPLDVTQFYTPDL